MNTAVANRAVDVGWQVEPFVAQGVAAGLFDAWKTLDEASQDQQENLVLLAPKFSQNREAALRFLVAYLAGVRSYLRDALGTDRSELNRILASEMRITDPQAQRIMLMQGIDPNGVINKQSIEESLKIYQDQGSIPPGEIKLDWITDDLRIEALSHLPAYGG
jgi:hypothetical protein